jgi:hypothetical protein
VPGITVVSSRACSAVMLAMNARSGRFGPELALQRGALECLVAVQVAFLRLADVPQPVDPVR